MSRDPVRIIILDEGLVGKLNNGKPTYQRYCTFPLVKQTKCKTDQSPDCPGTALYEYSRKHFQMATRSFFRQNLTDDELRICGVIDYYSCSTCGCTTRISAGGSCGYLYSVSRGDGPNDDEIKARTWGDPIIDKDYKRQ